jgi:hypothetical protein
MPKLHVSVDGCDVLWKAWPLKLYDQSKILWLQNAEQVETYMTLVKSEIRRLYGLNPTTFEGCLVLDIGLVGSAKRWANDWVDYPIIEEFYSEEFNEILAKHFPNIQGLVLTTLTPPTAGPQVPHGWDGEYSLQNLPPGLTYLGLYFPGNIDLSHLSWTNIECLDLFYKTLGVFIDEFMFPFDHPYPKLKMVLTSGSSHRSTEFCTAVMGDQPRSPFEKRMVSFRNF